MPLRVDYPLEFHRILVPTEDRREQVPMDDGALSDGARDEEDSKAEGVACKDMAYNSLQGFADTSHSSLRSLGACSKERLRLQIDN